MREAGLLFNIDKNHIRNIYCVGRNYIDHIRELGNPKPERPLIFGKPVSSIAKGGVVRYPAHSRELHFEGEMVFLLSGSMAFSDSDELTVGCGIDFTARDVQEIAKKNGWPWFAAKSFRDAAAVSDQFFSCRFSDLQYLAIQTRVNGKLRQQGAYTQTIFRVEDIVDYLRRHVDIMDHDLLFTGTPAGVGAVEIGDTVEVSLSFQDTVKTTVACDITGPQHAVDDNRARP